MPAALTMLEQLVEEEGPVVEEEAVAAEEAIAAEADVLAPKVEAAAKAAEAEAEALAQEAEAEGKAILTDIKEVLGDGDVGDLETCATNDVPTPMGGRAIGNVSGRPFDPDLAGGAIEDLSTEGIQITHEGIDTVEQHIERFGPDEANQAMVARLRSIANGEMAPTEYDLNYYTHEMREFERYSNLGWGSGQPADPNAAYELWNNAHTATLEDYGLKDNQLYHPDALK